MGKRACLKNQGRCRRQPRTVRQLTQGLARNTAYNLVGWIWPFALAFATVPYIVSSLGNDAYGVFALVSIVGGYLGLLSGPAALGNVRFMAEAYGREAWSELRDAAATGLVINVTLSALGAIPMFCFAGVLARSVFKVPPDLVETAIAAFRMAAISFLLNGIVAALQSVPSAMRRYDMLNVAGLLLGSINTAAIVLALWLGWGLLGAVVAQVFSSLLALAVFVLVAWLLLRRLPAAPDHLSTLASSDVWLRFHPCCSRDRSPAGSDWKSTALLSACSSARPP